MLVAVAGGTVGSATGVAPQAAPAASTTRAVRARNRRFINLWLLDTLDPYAA
jgi:hypothetical protein